MGKIKNFIILIMILGIASIVYAGTAKQHPYGIRLADEGADHGTPPSGLELFNNSGTLKYINSSGVTTTLSAGTGDNTLDNAYDQGGAGAGRTITADTGAVKITNTDADAAFLLDITPTPSSSAAMGGIVITSGANCTQDALEFANSGSGNDIYGTSGTWAVSAAGASTFTGMTTSGAATSINASSNYATNINTGSSTGTITLGGGFNTVAVNSSSWDISTAGAMSGISSLSMSDDLTIANGKSVKGNTTDTHTWSLQTYDVDGAAYIDTILFTNANSPTVVMGTGAETMSINSVDWDISTAGNMTGIGAITSDGLATLALGATISGATTSINASSNFATNINTGTSTGALSLGGGSGTVAINSSDWDISATGVTTGIASIAMDAAAANITLTSDGAADDFTVQLAGATDSSLILASSGTAADALQINASAGGVLTTTAGAMADQFKVNATGTVAGNAINHETTDGGILFNADGAANGDITIDAADVLTLTTPDTVIVNGGTGAIEFEGATADDYETTISITDPTTDNTITVPDYAGAMPLVIGQGYTQTSQAGAGTSDVTGSSLTLADGWFLEGSTIRYTVVGSVTGANAAISVALYLEDGAKMTLQTTDGAAGDYVAEFEIIATASNAQRIQGKLVAEGGTELKCDYATASIDTAAAGTIPIKLQITSGNAGDTITSEMVKIEYWLKTD